MFVQEKLSLKSSMGSQKTSLQKDIPNLPTGSTAEL